MQAIVTKYLGPTNTRGARIKATADAGSVTVGYDHSAHNAHDVAVVALREKLGWAGEYGDMIRGSLPGNGGYVYVFASGERV